MVCRHLVLFSTAEPDLLLSRRSWLALLTIAHHPLCTPIRKDIPVLVERYMSGEHPARELSP